MSEVRKTKGVVDATEVAVADDHASKVVFKTIVELNLAIDALRALANLLRFAEADEENSFMYSPECIGVMVAGMAEVIDETLAPLKMLHFGLSGDGGKHHG